MKRGIKNGYLRNIRPKKRKARLIPLKIGRIVQRRKRDHFFHVRNNIFIKQNAFCIFFTALNNTMADCIDFLKGIKHFQITLRHQLHYGIKSIDMRRNFAVKNQLVLSHAINDIFFTALYRQTDSFYGAFTDYGFILHIYQLEFQ